MLPSRVPTADMTRQRWDGQGRTSMIDGLREASYMGSSRLGLEVYLLRASNIRGVFATFFFLFLFITPLADSNAV